MENGQLELCPRFIKIWGSLFRDWKVQYCCLTMFIIGRYSDSDSDSSTSTRTRTHVIIKYSYLYSYSHILQVLVLVLVLVLVNLVLAPALRVGQCSVMCRSTFSLYFFVRLSFGLGDWRFDLKSMEWGIPVWYCFCVNWGCSVSRPVCRDCVGCLRDVLWIVQWTFALFRRHIAFCKTPPPNLQKEITHCSLADVAVILSVIIFTHILLCFSDKAFPVKLSPG